MPEALQSRTDISSLEAHLANIGVGDLQPPADLYKGYEVDDGQEFVSAQIFRVGEAPLLSSELNTDERALLEQEKVLVTNKANFVEHFRGRRDKLWQRLSYPFRAHVTLSTFEQVVTTRNVLMAAHGEDHPLVQKSAEKFRPNLFDALLEVDEAGRLSYAFHGNDAKVIRRALQAAARRGETAYEASAVALIKELGMQASKKTINKGRSQILALRPLAQEG